MRKLVDNYIVLNKSFKEEFYKPIQDFINRDMWFMKYTTQQYVYIFHPLKIVQQTDKKVVECFVMQGVEKYTHETKNLTIQDFIKAGEIIDRKALKELSAELAKFMLQREL